MATELVLFAAGSLRGALNEAAAAFTRRYALPVRTEYGPSGVLRERLQNGEHPDVFASADKGHPTRLMDANLSGPVALYILSVDSQTILAPHGFDAPMLPSPRVGS